MPTTLTLQILGNCEAFEPYTTNIYKCIVLRGDFMVVNLHLMHNLMQRGLWSKKMKNTIIRNNSSIQNIDKIP
jgi:ribonucleoside-diphosphate reductase alpha chain